MRRVWQVYALWVLTVASVGQHVGVYLGWPYPPTVVAGAVEAMVLSAVPAALVGLPVVAAAALVLTATRAVRGHSRR